jgi:hypothetical protein
MSPILPRLRDLGTRAMKRRNDEVVSASEVASWVYCPEAWRLQAHGHPAGNVEALEAGERRHAETVALEVKSGAALKLGWWLVAAAVLIVATLAFAFFFARGL